MAQTLTTTILINAKTGSGFSEIGSTLTELGSIVNGTSQELINFGKESIEVYRDYEKSMADAEVALSTIYGRNSRELSSVMSQLDASATEWAATTIFHTDDVANAISNAAHAGWDFDQIMSGIPAAMELAQAGSLDLSEAVDYIVKSSNAAKIPFEDMGTFIDHWTYAANSSATNIDEMGEAMLKMGATMRFAGSSDELLVMLAELANAGTVGSSAGTLLRNSILRLVAPTKNAREAMAELGATSEETEAIMNDEALAAANARLAAAGFSAYDEDGNLKGMLDTYSELYLALGEIAGGYENIAQNEDANAILSAIFPTRSITGALAMIEAAGEGYHGLYEELQNGAADEYGSYAADRMMNTLNGSIETFNSKMERLKQVVGEELAPQLESVLGSIGGMVDKIAGMDEASFSALVSGLEVIAAAGPGLLLAGGALRLIGAISSMGEMGLAIMGVAAGTTALVTAIAAYEQLAEADFEGNFGSLELDTSEVQSQVSNMAGAFADTYANINEYSAALEDAVTSYQTASSELKGELLTNLFSGMELTDTQIESMNNLGDQMITEVMNGIELHHAILGESIKGTLERGTEGGEGSAILDQIMGVIRQGYENDIAEAEALSQRLRDAMTNAFADGHLNAEEIANIQSIMDEQNALIAKQQDREHALERERILRKAQTLGLESIEESSKLIEQERDAEWETLMDRQAADRYDTAAYYDEAIKNGWLIEEIDSEGNKTGEMVKARPGAKKQALSALEQSQLNDQLAFGADFSNYIMSIWSQGIRESDLAGTWSAMETLGADLRASGGIVTPEAQNAYNSSVSASDSADTSRYLNMMVDALGGIERIQEYADYYSDRGETERAGQYQSVMDMYAAMGGGTNAFATYGIQGTAGYENAGTYDQVANLLSGYSTALTPEGLVEYMNQAINDFHIEPDWMGTMGEDLYYAMSNSAQQAGYDSITSMVSALSTEMQPVPLPITPMVEGDDPRQALEDQGATVTVDADMQQIEATIDGINGQNILTYINGDASDLEMSISDQDGRTIATNVTGNTAQLAQAIAAYENRTITVNIAGRRLFASGGRATTASIFGEAGPEWAIPEEHSERTAGLLNAAREASGFSWGDLLARYGGLNSNTDAAPSTLVYSPTINAVDAAGVDQVLSNDKDRLNRWYEEKRMRDNVEVYA